MKHRVHLAGLTVALTLGSGSVAFAQSQSSGLDIAGSWVTIAETGVGGATVMLTDYGGVPFNEAGRLYALTWDRAAN